jgi:DNA-binding CsgD family transcriptional regulator
MRLEALVGSVYDAAVDGRLWDQALVMLGRSTGSALAAIEIHDLGSDALRGHNPMMAPEYREPYLSHWRRYFSLRKRTVSFPVGRVILPSEIIDFATETKTAFYNEWVRPQGCCVSARFANLFSGEGTVAVLAAWKPSRKPEFSPAEERLFATATHHFVRAVAIHRRLRLAEAQQAASAAGAAPAGFLVVNRTGCILAADEPTRLRLSAAGVIVARGDLGSLDIDHPALKRLVAGSCADRPCEGRTEHRGDDGTLLRLVMVPIREGITRPDAAWLPISEPAGLLLVTAPEDAVRESVRRLAEDYGLTRAEAAVALEVSKGDGRAAVASRLGIRETTVRSHLSTIFDKLGLHRQAELTRLVTGRWSADGQRSGPDVPGRRA